MRKFLIFLCLIFSFSAKGKAESPFGNHSKKCRIDCGTAKCGSSEEQFHNCLRSCRLTPIMKKCIAEGLRKGYSIPSDVLPKFQKYLDYLSLNSTQQEKELTEEKLSELKESMLAGTGEEPHNAPPQKTPLSEPTSPQGRMDLAPRSAPHRKLKLPNSAEDQDLKTQGTLYVVPYSEDFVDNSERLEKSLPKKHHPSVPEPSTSDLPFSEQDKTSSSSLRNAPSSDQSLEEQE